MRNATIIVLQGVIVALWIPAAILMIPPMVFARLAHRAFREKDPDDLGPGELYRAEVDESGKPIGPWKHLQHVDSFRVKEVDP